MNPIERTSAQTFIPYAPFEILVINPDRFLEMREMVKHLRRVRRRVGRRVQGYICHACILGKHMDCAGCPCLTEFHSGKAHSDGGPGPGRAALGAPAS